MKFIFELNYQSNEPLKNLEALFRELTVKLSEKSASVQTRFEPKCAVVELMPTNPNAAPITVIVPFSEEREVTLIAGKGSFFEIPLGGHRYTDLPLIEEVRSICLAVIAGTLQESVLLDGDEVLQGTGSIKLSQASAPTTVRWRQIYFRPFRKKEKKYFKYAPY